MSKEERQPYEGRAQLARESYNPARLTTDGFEVEEVERKEKEQATKLQDMKNDITRRLKAASFAMNLDEEVFLIGHINHLIYYPTQDKYFICEVAIAAMSLKNGIEDVYHAIVKPGKLPLGYYGGALAHSKETHQLLQVVHDEPYEDNTEEIFWQMTQFMRKFTPNNASLILYTDEKTFEMTVKVIDNFREQFNCPIEMKVYNLQYMFYALRNSVAGRPVWPTETFSYSELEKDIYSYTPDISCDFHEMTDISVYCSKSIVTRYAYTICDHCCEDLKIQLIPGFHVPQKAKVVTESRTTSQAQSVCSTEGFRSVTRSKGGGSSASSAYDNNYPPLSSRSSAASVVSFSSMKTAPMATKAAARIEQSFKALSFKEVAQRDHGDLKFPQHGSRKRDN